jgi:hypothetical protein
MYHVFGSTRTPRGRPTTASQRRVCNTAHLQGFEPTIFFYGGRMMAIVLRCRGQGSRWCSIFITKMPDLVYFRRLWYGNFWFISLTFLLLFRYVLWPFGVLWTFWYIFPISVCCTQKNLANLVEVRHWQDFFMGYLSCSVTAEKGLEKSLHGYQS